MSVVLEIVFWTSLAAIFHTYLFYPLILSWRARNKRAPTAHYIHDEEFPYVSVIMSVYNEEVVITDKVKSLFVPYFLKFLWQIHSTQNENDIIMARN